MLFIAFLLSAQSRAIKPEPGVARVAASDPRSCRQQVSHSHGRTRAQYATASTRAILLLLLALAALVALPGCESALVRLAVSGQPVENGKLLNMTFEELERTRDASVFKVTFITGGSVSSSLFILHGQCAIARARNKPYFASAEIPGQDGAWRMTFPTKAPSDDETRISNGIWTIEDCERFGF